MVLQEMETSSSINYGDEDGASGFIDMEVASATSSPRFRYSGAPIQSREFEFQMSSFTVDKDSTTCCPADELFYKGKLLPLHLPPRLKLVEKLILHDDNVDTTSPNPPKALEGNVQNQFRNPLFRSATAPCTNSNTPLDISPSESCRASTELNPDEYFFDWSTDITSLIATDTHDHHQCKHHLHSKNSWSRKIKHSSLGKKLKASRTYLKSLFNKPVRSNDDVCGQLTSNADEDEDEAAGGGCVLKAKECVSKCIKVANKNRPFGSLQHEKFNISSLLLLKNSDKTVEDGQTRKSFSGAINWSNAHTTVKSKCSSTLYSSGSSSSSSSSFSFNFNGFYELQLLKRSSSADSDLDGSVEGAIAHCRQSQNMQCN